MRAVVGSSIIDVTTIMQDIWSIIQILSSFSPCFNQPDQPSYYDYMNSKRSAEFSDDSPSRISHYSILVVQFCAYTDASCDILICDPQNRFPVAHGYELGATPSYQDLTPIDIHASSERRGLDIYNVQAESRALAFLSQADTTYHIFPGFVEVEPLGAPIESIT